MYALLCVVFAAANFTNPVLNTNAPDPGVMFWQGEYYMVTTSGGAADSFPIHKSKDLIQWTQVGFVFPKDNRPSWAKADFWAPELHTLADGSINVYYTARTAGGLLSVGAAKSSSGKPEGPYKDRGSPIVTNSLGVIDPNFFKDDDGKQYLITKVDGNSQSKPTPFNIRELDHTGLEFTSGSTEHRILDITLPWEGGVIEGPWMIKRGGYYYLFYSSNNYGNSWYSVGLARSKTLFGTYEKGIAPTLSQVVAKSVNGWEGPGHCSVLQNVGSSKATIMVYHSWVNGKGGQAPGRLVLVDRVTWTADNWAMTGDSYTPSTLSTFSPLSDGQAQWRVEVGATYVFRAIQFPNSYWCYNGSIDCKNQFTVRTGLAGGNAYSFEATSKPGHFMRHSQGLLRLDPLASDTGFHLDATFMVLSGTSSTGAASFRSVNYPSNFIRHKNGILKIDSSDSSDTFFHDATFVPIRA